MEMSGVMKDNLPFKLPSTEEIATGNTSQENSTLHPVINTSNNNLKQMGKKTTKKKFIIKLSEWSKKSPLETKANKVSQTDFTMETSRRQVGSTGWRGAVATQQFGEIGQSFPHSFISKKCMWVAVNTFKEEQFNAKGSFNWEENAIDQQMVILLPNVSPPPTVATQSSTIWFLNEPTLNL